MVGGRRRRASGRCDLRVYDGSGNCSYHFYHATNRRWPHVHLQHCRRERPANEVGAAIPFRDHEEAGSASATTTRGSRTIVSIRWLLSRRTKRRHPFPRKRREQRTQRVYLRQECPYRITPQLEYTNITLHATNR